MTGKSTPPILRAFKSNTLSIIYGELVSFRDPKVEPNSTNCRVIYRGKLFELVHEDFHLSSGMKTFEFARRGPGTRILLLASDNRLLLTREYRRELGGYDVRLPGGKVFDSLAEYEAARSSGKHLQEFAKDAAKRELLEETGYLAEDVDYLGISKCGATIEWDLYFFLCTRWTPPKGKVLPCEDEDIFVMWEYLSAVKKLCLQGTISEERSALQILRYLKKLGEV